MLRRIRIKFPDGRVFAELDDETSLMVRLYAKTQGKTVPEVIDELVREFMTEVKAGRVNPLTGEKVEQEKTN